MIFGFLANKFAQLTSSVSSLWSKGDKTKLTYELKQILIDSDVPLAIVNDFSLNVINAFEEQAKKLPKADKQELLHAALYRELVKYLGADSKPDELWLKPGIILFMGLQGAGKTTTVAKIGHWLTQSGRFTNQQVLCTSLDFMRPAAIEQLQIMCQKAQIQFIEPVLGSMQASLKKALELHRQAPGSSLLIDTAGRLNVDAELMAELRDVCAVTKPTIKTLVLDAMTGQKSIDVASDFQRQVGIDCAILTKMDSDARGGAAIALRHISKAPISFIATGEKVDDLEPFIASRIASRLVGTGDIESLVERLDKQLKKTTADGELDLNGVMQRLQTGKFTLQDFLFQMETMGSLGSMNKVLSYIPGFGRIGQAEIEKAEEQTKVFRSLIQSMTLKERLQHKLLAAPSRKQRVCAGAGRRISDLELLLEKFEQTRYFAKMMMSKFGR